MSNPTKSNPTNVHPVFGVPSYYLGRPNTAFIGRYPRPPRRRRRRPAIAPS